jgi:hypothetical protein
MAYGYGFGFRGGSPPWPYIGRGRGGLPRCWHPDLWAYSGYGPWATPYYQGVPYAYTREDEIGFLRGEAEAVRDELTEIERRIQELESKEE